MFPALPFCTRCGRKLLETDNFCPGCGLDIRAPAQVEQPQTAEPLAGARGLGRNTVVYLKNEGLLGVQVSSDSILFLAFVIPIPILASIYYFLQDGTLSLYFALWVAASGLIYDELRWHGLVGLGESSPDDPQLGRKSWLIPWSSIRMADWNGRTLWFSSTGRPRKLSVTFDEKDAPSVQQSMTASGVRYSWRGPRLPELLTRFTTLAIILFVAAQVIIILAATTPFLPGEEAVYKSVLNNTQSQIVGSSFLGEFQAIFLNNLQVALGGAVPFLGTIGFGLASYNTGRVIQLIALDAGASPLRILAVLYILPHTWVEESAYPIAAAAGMLGVTKWRSVTPEDFAKWTNWGSTKLAVALAGAGLILIVAGLIETLTTYLGILGIALWVPLIFGAYLLVKSFQKKGGDVGPMSP